MIGSTLGESLAMTNDNSFVKKRKHVPFLQINRVHAWKSWTSAFRVKAINSLSPLIFFLKWNKIANNMNIIWVRLSDDSFLFFFHFSFFFGLVSVILFFKIYIYIFFGVRLCCQCYTVPFVTFYYKIPLSPYVLFFI